MVASMEVPEALPRPHKFSHHFLSSPPPCFDWFPSPSRYAHQQYDNVSKLALCVGNHNFHKRSAVMSLRNEKSVITSKDYCEVNWTVEADLADGQVLYLSGDTADLGCWNTEMAIPMSPGSYPNLWKARFKVPSGVNFKYNYFIRESVRPDNVIWRPGPEFSLLVPVPTNEGDRNIVVRDSWLKSAMKSESYSTHGWGSWIEENETCTIPPIHGLISRDEDEIVESAESGFDLLKVEPFISGRDALDQDLHNSDSRFCERDQPVEEPWLVQILYSLLLKDAEVYDSIHHEQHQQATDKLLTGEGKDLVSTKHSVSTIILINSSICTMQRIAVLEDGTLVELLLEPVKSNVQCDSVYLGVVTKLVPNMGGAFVSIGNSRHCLMDIRRYREPFIFPPFSTEKMKQEADGFSSESFSSSESSSEDTPGKYVHEEYEENEDEDDFDVLEILKGSSNGSIINSGESAKDDRSKSKNHQGGESSNDSSICKVESLNNANMSFPEAVKASAETWNKVRKGTKVIVQVVKEGLGTKSPTLSPYPKLRSRFWVLITRCDKIGVSKKIIGMERTRLKVIARTLQPQGFGLTVRTVAAGHSLEELQKDLESLLTTWKNIVEHAKSAALAADEGVEGAVPVILHRAMGQTLSVVQDYFNERVTKMVIDSARTLHEVTNYLQEIAPDLCDRVELYNQRHPLFDEFNIEAEIDNILSKRVPLANGGSLIIEQTEALVSIDVNGGHGMLGQDNSQGQAILDVNLAAAKQIARELRLRDIGGIIVVDFIDMADESNKRLVYEEMKKAVERDRSRVSVSELSNQGLMEMTRKRVRPSVTFMISEPCSCCHATGRVEALETSFSKIEQEICRSLANMDSKANPEDPKSWPRFILRVDHHMCEFLTSGKKTRIAILSSSLKVWILMKVAREFTRGKFEVKPFCSNDGNKMVKNQTRVSIPKILRPKTTDGREAANKDSRKKVNLFPVKKLKAAG